MEIEEAKSLLGEKFSFIFDDTIIPLLHVLDVNKNANILDVGTGEGKMAISLALQGYAVLTGEPESDHSEYAKQDWLNSAKKVRVDHLITFKAFNAEEMPFKNDEFDVVFMMGALHHMKEINLALNECIRIVKPGRHICIIEPNEKGTEIIRKRKPLHPDAIDPRTYLGHLPVKIIKSSMFNAFIFEKKKGQ